MSTIILSDRKTATSFKRTADIRRFVVDFHNRLSSGENIVSIDSSSISPSTAIITISTVNNNSQISLTISGGTDSTTYTVNFAVTTSAGNTLSDFFFLYVADPVQNAGSFKPPIWNLEIGKRLLKGITSPLVELGNELNGLTEEDLQRAEDFAWNTLISRLAAYYDATTWNIQPPIPLFDMWEYLSSAFVVKLYGERVESSGEITTKTAKSWIADADKMIAGLTDPDSESERIYLINYDGTIQYPRSRIATPTVRNIGGAVFFPNTLCDTSYGISMWGSVEQFVKENTRYLQSNY